MILDDSPGILQTEAQQCAEHKGKKNMINEIITPKHEYYDDTHFVWRRVPSFWVGDFVASHSHKIVLWKDIKE
jgi:hypothetical protein